MRFSAAARLPPETFEERFPIRQAGVLPNCSVTITHISTGLVRKVVTNGMSGGFQRAGSSPLTCSDICGIELSSGDRARAMPPPFSICSTFFEENA